MWETICVKKELIFHGLGIVEVIRIIPFQLGPHGPVVTLGGGIKSFLAIRGKLGNGNGSENTNDRNNDQKFDQGETLFRFPEFFQHLSFSFQG